MSFKKSFLWLWPFLTPRKLLNYDYSEGRVRSRIIQRSNFHDRWHWELKGYPYKTRRRRVRKPYFILKQGQGFAYVLQFYCMINYSPYIFPIFSKKILARQLNDFIKVYRKVKRFFIFSPSNFELDDRM